MGFAGQATYAVIDVTGSDLTLTLLLQRRT